MNSYELSRNWFDWCFANPEKPNPNHHAIYFFAIEHCNRLGWKDKFGFPSQMVMEAIGIKNWRTYSVSLNDLVEWGFIKMIEKSKNQYSSNIIAIVKNTKAHVKALDKALQKHSAEQGKSIVSIDKQYNNKPNNKEQEEKPKKVLSVDDFLVWFNDQGEKFNGKLGNFRILSKTTTNNLRELRKTHPNTTDWSKAYFVMSRSEWVKETKNCTPDHFLRVNNFTKYLNQFDAVYSEYKKESEPKKFKAPWD